MAHKKAAGSAKNLRDSNPKYRGLKLNSGQFARAGNIIIRQKGDKYQLGNHVYKGRDFTIHASVDGVVSFRKKNFKRYDGRIYLKTVIDIIPAEEVKKRESSKKTIEKDSIKTVFTAEIDSFKDDLTKIEGIGPKIQEVFNSVGIVTFSDLSVSKVADLRIILADNGLGKHNPRTWKKQATLAKNNKRDELKILQDELNGGL